MSIHDYVVRQVAGLPGTPNVVIADYTDYKTKPDTIERYLAITREEREAFDDQVARTAAAEVLKRLPATAAEQAGMIRRGYELANQMSWEIVASDYVLPVLNEIVHRKKSAGAA